MTGTYEQIRYATAGPRATITLHRPEKLNAITAAMMSEVRAALSAAESDAGIRVVVIEGAGRAFSSGYDLSPRPPARTSAEWQQRFGDTNDTLDLIWRLGKPVIAQIHGPCLGAAFDIAMTCDLAVASEDATFGEPEIRYGGTCQYLLLPWLVGMKAAKHILLTGSTIPAGQALALGLVNQVVPPDQLPGAVDRLCREISAVPLGVPAMNKRALNRAYELMGAAEAVRASQDLAVIAAMGISEETAELHAVIAKGGLKAGREWLEARAAGGRGGAD